MLPAVIRNSSTQSDTHAPAHTQTHTNVWPTSASVTMCGTEVGHSVWSEFSFEVSILSQCSGEQA